VSSLMVGIRQVRGGALELDIELFSEHGPASLNLQITEDRFTVISN
jgi:hypothetical protein